MNELAGIPNPFGDSVVQDPWHTECVDIPEIHADASRKLESLIDAVRAHKSTSLIVTGEAGAGKSHLVMRLRKYLASKNHPAVLCWVRMNGTIPSSIWQFIRCAMVTDLLRKVDSEYTQLDKLLESRIPKLNLPPVAPGQSFVDFITSWLPKGPTREQIVADFTKSQSHMTSEVRRVLAKVYSKHRELAADWLKGDQLCDADLDTLGIARRVLSNAQMERQSRDVVLALCRLSHAKLPLVLGFDQVEGMQANSHAPSKALCTFTQIAGELIDLPETRILMAWFMRTDCLDRTKKAAGASIWHRINRHQCNLALLKWEEHVAPLVMQRLNSQPLIKAIRESKSQDQFWPLAKESVLKAFNSFTSTGCTARRMLTKCEELYNKRGTDPIKQPPNPITVRWEQTYTSLKSKVVDDPLKAVEVGLPFVLQVVQSPYAVPVDAKPIIAHATLTIERKEPTHRMVAFVYPAGGHVWRKLEYLLKAWPDCDKAERLILVRPPLNTMTPAARERTAKLAALPRVVCVEPSPEQLACLRALSKLLQDAHNGSLVYDGDHITPDEVLAWARSVYNSDPLHEVTASLKQLLNDLPDAILHGKPAAAKPKKAASAK